MNIFNEARQDTRVDLNLTPPRMRPPAGRLPRSGNNKFFLDANEGASSELAPGGGGDGEDRNSVFQNHRGNSLRYGDGAAPLFVQQPLEQLIDGPVVLVNWRSKRKLYAQTCKKPTMFETWAKGFGAGPELKTFKDNKWWLLPQGDNIYVVVNGYSSRKLFAKQLQRGAKWELNCGAGPSEETGSDTLWRIEQDSQTGAFVVQNVQSKRKLFARMPHRGDKWSAGVGAAPSSHVGTETLWNIMPDDAPHEGTSDPTEMSHFWAAHLQQTGAATAAEAPAAANHPSSNEPLSGSREKEGTTTEKSKSSKSSKNRSSSSRDLDGSSSSAPAAAKPETEKKKSWFQSKKKSTASSVDLEDDILDGNVETKPKTPKKKERKSSADDILGEDDDISGGLLGGREDSKKVKKKVSRSGSADDILGEDDDISGGQESKKVKKKVSRTGSEDDILDGGDLKKKEKKKKEKSELVTKSSSAEDTYESDLAGPPDASKKSSSKSKDSKKKSPRAGDAGDLQSFSRKNSISDASSSSSKGERSGKRSPGKDRSRELSKQHSDNHFQEDDPYL